ncbi:hypothetical protein STINGER_78 [Mycobacterium phage Stinger]|uniref:Uncharacterized protein n=1 Tax=Mycobacterium phage Stinger TaxID=1089137 RepID=G8I9J9_9CAUD|nr:hypothetical protein STINGER_78 [Mycobacterium phage Stinger]AER49392.1 hypothetical protein STINGER_78 [Mycobacterium phage Stinger]
MTFDTRVPCRRCGHRTHSAVDGCASCLPGIDCGPVPDQPEHWPRILGDGPAYDMRDFTLGEREVICAQCHLIHRPGQECP